MSATPHDARTEAGSDEERAKLIHEGTHSEEDPDASKSSWREDCWRDKGFYTIIIVVAFVQGASYLSKLATNYFFKDDLKLSPAAMAVASGVVLVPWVIKPVYGFISDTYPIFQRRRQPYFFLFGFTGFFSWISLAYFARGLVEAVLCLVGASLSLAFVNVLAEALIVEKGGQSKGDHEATKTKISRLMTLYWGTESFAKIISGFSSGFLIASVGKSTIFAMTGMFPAMLCLLAFFLNEKPQQKENKFCEQWNLLITHLKKPYIWKPALFMFVWQATPSSQASYFYFLTNEIKLKPEFMGTLHLVEGSSSLLALAVYNLFLTKVAYRRILYWTIILAFIAGLTPLILITRVNRQLGLPDQAFVIGDAALLAGVGQIAIMPLLVLGAQTCPPQVEGTLYALLMSTLNIGGVVSDNLGGLLTYLIGVTATDFSRLWILVLICNICNLIPIPLLYFLVPTEEEFERIHKQTREERDVEAEEAVSTGRNAQVDVQADKRATIN